MKTTHAPVLAGWLFLVAGSALLGCSGGGGTPDASTAGTAGTGTAGTAGTGTAGAAGTGTTGGSGGAVGGGGGGNAGGGASGGSGSGGGAASGGTGGVAGTGVAGAAGGTGGAAGTGGTSGASGTGGAAGRGGTGGGAGRGGTGGGAGRGGTGGGAGGSATRYTCPSGSFTPPNPSSITLTKVAGVPPFDAFNNNGNNFGNIEGTVWFGDALYVSEIGGGNNPPPARILRVPTTGAVSIAYSNSGTNGLAIDLMGRLIGASHTAGGIWAFDLTNMLSTPIVMTYVMPPATTPARFNTPNDLTVRSDGTIYFTDPDFQAPSPRPQTQTRVYRLPPGSTTATVVDATLTNPNGITLSLDEAFLFVTAGQGLMRYPVNADGTTGTRTQIAQGAVSGGDGMAMDCSGTLYVTSGNRLYLIDPTGAGMSRGSITVNAQSATNVAFGGANHQTLYVSGQGNGTGGGATMGLFRADMPLPGMPY